jgi:hypothetical protein
LDAHLAQGKYKYVTVKCNNKDCRASLNFGQQQENPDVFYLKLRDKADGTGKEQDWRMPPVQNNGGGQMNTQQPQQQFVQQPMNQNQAQQQVQNYTQQPRQ